MSKAVGGMGLEARWFTRVASRIAGDVPPTDATWRWSEVELERSELTKLRRAGLIVQTSDGEWQTTRKLIREVANYARVDEDDVTCVMDVQASLADW